MPIVVKTLQMAALVLFGIVKIHFTGKIQYIWFVKDDPISDALALNDPKRFQIFFLILEETAIQYEIKYSLMIFFILMKLAMFVFLQIIVAKHSHSDMFIQ